MQKTLLSFFAKTPAAKPAAAPASASSALSNADKPPKPEPASPYPPNNASPVAQSSATPVTATKKRPAPEAATTSPRGASGSVDRTPVSSKQSAAKPKSAGKSPRSTPRPAKRRVLADSDDEEAGPASASESEAEFAPSSGGSSSESEDLQPTSESEGDVESDASAAAKKAKRKVPANPKKTPASSPAASRKPKSMPSNPAASPARGGTADDDNDGAVAAGATPDVYPHMTWPWLHADRRDANGRKPDHPDYDPRTLTVDKEFLEKQTPGHHVWWSFKSKNMDCVLLFKVGKFYETYHMDADVLVKELDLVYMKGLIAHAGFPEIAYGRFSDALVAKGYRVARVEQTETPEMLKERNATTTKGVRKDKVVRRELCCLKSPGTRTFSFLDRRQDSDYSSAQESQDDRSGVPALLMAIYEQPLSAAASGSRLVTSYGIAIADASTAKFCLAQFPDDRSRTRLRTLLAQAPPAELLTLRGNLDEFSQRILRYDAPSAARSELPPKEFPSPQATLKLLQDPKYFSPEASTPTPIDSLPEFLQGVAARVSAENDDVAVLPGGSAMTAFGAMILYLQRCLIDQSLLSLAQFYAYVPPVIADNAAVGSSDTSQADHDSVEPTQPSETVVANVPIGFTENSARMVLDGTTIVNLDIVANSVDGGRKGSLLDTLDRCVTAQGKRTFTQWLCAPLRHAVDINARLEAVGDLMGRRDLMDTVRTQFKQLPDIDRLLSRVHTLGLKLAPDHPENRAVYYEASTYNKRKIRDFLTALRGLKVARRVQDMFVNPHDPTQLIDGLSSRVLKDLMVDKTPDISKILAFFDGAFDAKQAEAQGCIIPKRGVDDSYDNALDTIARVETHLAQYLESQKAVLRCRDIEYFHNKANAKDRYQIEVPEASCKNVPDSYALSSQRKGYRRYTTDESTALVNQLCKAEEAKAAAIADTMRRMFSRFDKHYSEFAAVSAAMSYLDCLMSLVLWSSSSDIMCKPEFLESEEPYLELREVRHPTLVGLTSTEFIPNDIVLGTRASSAPHPTCVLLTGPNMGGKSTLLRQACLASIIAQMGAYVPAKSCVLTPVDRVFTRVGASDRILAGQSTFFVELTETSSILRLATRRSLVILDELGRGTSTFDGNAIAYAVVKHLTDVIGARTMFATHYHSLCEEFCTHPRVGLAHMGCIAEELPDGTSNVTFLYKLTPGACPKSYGLNVARLAHLPESIIQAANLRSSQFEHALMRSTAIHVTKQALSCVESGDAAALVKAWKSAKSAAQFDADVSM